MIDMAHSYPAAAPDAAAPVESTDASRVAETKAVLRPKRPAWLRAAFCLGISLAFGGATVGALSMMHGGGIRLVGFLGFGLAAASATLGVWFGGATMVGAMKSPHRPLLALSGLVLLGANTCMALSGALLALLSTASFSRGRQLRRFGKVLLPPLRAGSEWSHAMERIDVDAQVRSQVATQWRENAKTEHASVAAFARLTLDLMALGAPPRLIEAAHRDGLDEIRHAKICLSLAQAIDAKGESPASFPEAQRARTLPKTRGLALAKLAVDSLVDGALHEGVSARVIARLVKLAKVPAIRSALREIAADEGRHSAHGWDVVEWCLYEGGAPVLSALRGAVSALPRTMRSPLPAQAEDGSWHGWGIHGHALEAQEYAKAREHIVERVRAMTALPARAA